MRPTTPLMLAMLVGVSGTAHAQSTVAPTREELAQPAVETTDSTRARLSVENQIEHAPCALAAPAYANMRVNFRAVNFRNLPEDFPTDLSASWRGYEGRDLPIATLCEIRDRAATELRQLGYVAAVQVPPQRIENGGTVEFDLLLARLVTVRVRGDAGRSDRLLESFLNRLTEQKVFNSRDAERDLLLARALPGYEVRLVLRPAGTKPGEVIGDVEVTRQPVELQAAVHNLGSRSAGRVGGFAMLRLNDLTGMGDSTQISLFNTAQTREQTVLQADHEFALGNRGLRLGASVLHAWSKPDLGGAPISSRTLVGSLDLSYPLILRSNLAVHGSTGLELIDQKVLFGSQPFSLDKLRVAFLRANFTATEARPVTTLSGSPRWGAGGSLELRKGLAILDASPRCSDNLATCLALTAPTSRLNGDPSALVVRAAGRFDYRASPQWTISAAPRAQIANTATLGYEQFSTGNFTVGRGFDPGFSQGDDGIGTSIELGFGRPGARSPRELRLAPYIFYDTAWTWKKAVGGAVRDHLHSAGVGVRGQWGQRARFDLTLAQPLDRAGAQLSRGDTRLLFTLSTRVLPW